MFMRLSKTAMPIYSDPIIECGYMKKYIKEIVVGLIQLFMFYVFPLFAGPTDAMGMVFLIIFMTALLSVALGMISNRKVKFLYPMLIGISFMPSVFIYYNESAMVHAVWYLVLSAMGILVGTAIRKLILIISKLRFIK